jgi:hypothetical protein
MDAGDFTTHLNEAEDLFLDRKFETALEAFMRASSLAPLETLPVAGLAITYHALGQVTEARRLWKILIARDSRYLTPRWLRKDLHWPEALIAEAVKVIALM